MKLNTADLSVVGSWKNHLLLALLLFALLACSEQSAQPEAPAAPRVTVARPLVKMVTDWNEYTGRIAAVDTVEVRARVSGYLQSVNFKEGSIVQKGDLLYVIDPRPYQATLDAATAEVARAEASLRLAENDLRRVQRLIKSKTVSEEELDARTQQRSQAVAMLDLARAAERAARLNLEFTHIYSPIVGSIGKTSVTPGNLISGGESAATLLTTIVSLDPIHVYISADELDYLHYLRMAKSGERPSSRNAHNAVRVRLADEEEFVHEGYMDFVDNHIDEATGTMTGRGVFENPDLLLVPGMFAEVRLIGAGPYESLQIPDLAVGSDQSQQFVYVVDDNNVVQRRAVSLGRVQDGLRIISAGLTQEDRVIINGIQGVRAGVSVVPESSEIAAPDAADNQ